MKEFVEKLLNELNYQKEYNQIVYDVKPRTEHEKDLNAVLQSTYDSAIRIVKRLAGEYSVGEENAHTGWIPCSERLPEDDRDVLVVMSDGSMMVDFRTASSSGWFWSDNDDMPLAWHELPQPYQPKGEQL